MFRHLAFQVTRYFNDENISYFAEKLKVRTYVQTDSFRFPTYLEKQMIYHRNLNGICSGILLSGLNDSSKGVYFFDFQKVSGCLRNIKNCSKNDLLHDLFTSLNFHIFANYHVWLIFNGKRSRITRFGNIMKTLELRFSALSPPQRTVYYRGSTVVVARVMQGQKSRLCRDLQLVRNIKNGRQ